MVCPPLWFSPPDPRNPELPARLKQLLTGHRTRLASRRRTGSGLILKLSGTRSHVVFGHCCLTGRGGLWGPFICGISHSQRIIVQTDRSPSLLNVGDAGASGRLCRCFLNVQRAGGCLGLIHLKPSPRFSQSVCSSSRTLSRGRLKTAASPDFERVFES